MVIENRKKNCCQVKLKFTWMGSDLITVHITMHKLCKVKENYVC